MFFGANDVFENIDLNINENEKIALVGRNGSGKTTLLKVIAGELDLVSGSVNRNSRMNISFLKQNGLALSKLTVEEEFNEVFS